MVELSDLYSDQIFELAANAPQPGRLVQPQASVRKTSRICGSVIEVDLVVEAGVVSGYGHAVSACALGQAASAVVAREILGTSVPEFAGLRDRMAAMLKADGPPPTGRWADLACLAPVRAYPARHASTLLVFDAVVEALEKIESGSTLRSEG